MASPMPSDAVPKMIEWARRSAELSVEQVAAAENWDVQEIMAWEAGQRTPSLPRLRRLAKRYKRPLMVFYLVEPPKDFTVAKDFRLLPDGSIRRLSPELTFALRLAEERQRWAADYLEDNDEEPCELVRKVRLPADPKNVARTLRSRLGVSMASQVGCSHDSDAYALWKRSIEGAAIFVFQTSDVSVQEMRGCALVNKFAPVILINSGDSYTARTFTLMHELAHILLGRSTVTSGNAIGTLAVPEERVEKFCNDVAAEAIVPADEFVRRIPKNWKADDDAVIEMVARRFHVSRAVIGIRLVETGLADTDYLAKKWSQLQGTQSRNPDDEGHAIPQHQLVLSRNGESFTQLVVSAYHEGAIHGGELTGLLDMNMKHMSSLESAMLRRPAQSAT